MESGYAFLHPKNAFIQAQRGIKRDYAPIPFSPWRPCLPFLERHIPPAGPLPLIYRYVRVAWVVLTLPVWLGLVVLCEVLPQDVAESLGPAILPRRPGWTTWQRFTYPLLARSVWAVTFGLPPVPTPQEERSITFPARIWYGRGTDIEPLNVSFKDESERARWIKHEAVDPSGRIQPLDYVPASWVRSKKMTRKPKEGGSEVVMYLVGGGYITGHPLEASRVFDVARASSLPVLGVNYRKSVTSDRAFPAALQDTISAYAYLVRNGYTRIALAGDSAGAGLGLALMQYLAKMALEELQDGSRKVEEIIMPAKACFYSPWADLTFSHDYKETVYFDIIHPTMLRQAAAAYLGRLDSYANAEGADAKDSISSMRASHPYFSTALPSSVPSLQSVRTVAEKLGQKPPRFLVFVGGAELFSAECSSLCRNLRKAGLEVEEYREDDETHGFLLVPTFMSSVIQPALDRMGAFLTSP